MGLVYGTIALIALVALWRVGDGIARDLGSAYAEHLVLWHKERATAEVGRNLALARQLAENPSLIAWARNEDDPQKREQALEVLKSYRSRMDSSNYFLALADSGHYYFSQKGENPANGRPEHTLHKDDPQDAWFYSTLKSDAEFHINVDVDEKLGVTKAWINVPLRADGEILGLTGTGLELSRLVRNFTSSEKPGVTTMLLNRDGAIQIHPETSHIAFDTASRKDISNSLFNYVESEEGRERLNTTLDSLASGEERVAILSLNIEGKERLVAAAWMERLGWYTVATIDLSSILGWPEFLSLGGVLAAAMTALLIMLAFLLNPLILRPIDRLSHAAAKVTRGDYSVRVPENRRDELGTLSRGFNQMTSTLSDYTEDLEARVTERTHEAEAARQYFESILENTPVGIAFLDGERRIREVNSEFLRLFGYNEEDVLGQSPRFIYAEETTFQTIGKESYPVIAKGSTYRRDVDLMHANGSVFPCSMAGRAVNPQDLSQGYIWTLRDMTERVQMEKDLRAAKEEAESATKAKSKFLAHMSHEIRTPMNAVIGLAHLLSRTELTADQEDYVRKIINSSQALLGIINDILDFSKVEAGKLDLDHVAFDLHEALDNLSNVVSLKAEEKDLELLFAVEPDVPVRIMGDPLRLGQVLTNLATNAVKFTEKGNVVLAVQAVEWEEKDRARLRFAVRDTGVGLTQEQQENLFEAFEQVDASNTRQHEGTGLGLAISKQLVELMGGELRVESEPGEGSTFWFEAPFQVVQEARKPLVPHRLSGLRVLVVDDNETSRQILKGILGNFGCRVTTAVDGETGLAVLQQTEEPFHLVLMDWYMPGMNGIEATRRIKSESVPNSPPAVLMVTAYGRDTLKHAAEETGTDAFMTKPMNPSLLLNTILQVLGEKPRERAAGQDNASQEWSGLEDIRGASVLLAEDNEINQEVAVELLHQAGMSVTTAANGREALQYLDSESYDLVLMDVQMPEMDRLETTRRIWQEGHTVPVLAITAHAMEGDAQKSLDAGMNDHLTKPIDPDQLTQALIRWITPRESASYPQTREGRRREVTGHLPELEGLDTEQGLQNTGGSTNLYVKLLREFPGKNAEAGQNIRAARKAGRGEEAVRLAHSVKGAAASLGAARLSEAARELEEALRRGDEHEELEKLLNRFEEDLESICQSIERFYSKEYQDTSGEGPDQEQATHIIDRLRKLMEKGDVKAEDVAEELHSALSGAGLDAQLNALQDHITDVEFDKAKSLLEEIASKMDKETSHDG
ncbi:MAG: response regulator [Desulfohalobiaceae bacterium]|nr:response regulator [Desulfohalobiaceae bacterium]